MLSSFEYLPLDIPTKQIRGLWIEGSDADSPLRCKIEPIALQDNHVCLSYTWGDEPATKEILLNGSPFPMRPNLWDFLLQARQREMSRCLWIDAICIDQSNNEEKSQQVRLMSRIFQKAELVIVWLGAVSIVTVDAASKFNHAMERLSYVVDGSADVQAGPTRKHVSIDSKHAWYIFSSISPVECDAFLRLGKNSYFTRLWVLQEVLLAQATTVWCGNGTTTLDTLRYFIDAIEFHDPEHHSQQPSFDGDGKRRQGQERITSSTKVSVVRCHSSIRRHFKAEGLKSEPALCYETIRSLTPGDGNLTQHRVLMDLIEEFRNQPCGNRHDRVYGLSGLTPNGDHFTIDYNQDLECLCLNVLDFAASQHVEGGRPHRLSLHVLFAALQIDAYDVHQQHFWSMLHYVNERRVTETMVTTPFEELSVEEPHSTKHKGLGQGYFCHAHL